MRLTDDCDDCKATSLYRRADSTSSTTIAISLLPFLLTWIAAALVAYHRIFTALSNDAARSREGLPLHSTGASKGRLRDSLYEKWASTKTIARVVFSTSIGLSAVLVELLLCEIVDTLDPAARGLALRWTLSLSLILGVIVTPALEIHSVTTAMFGSPLDTASTKRTIPRFRLLLEVLVFGAWLLIFWWLPRTSILHNSLHDIDRDSHVPPNHAFVEACLERIGIIGISLMASLSGFAAVSSLWQTFGVRHRQISAHEIPRKETGLTATEEMLSAKQSRLRALQRKISEAGSTAERTSFMGKVVGSIRGNPDAQEIKALEMEISGLETMRFALSQSLSTLKFRFSEQQNSTTTSGKLANVFNTGFALYCAYRICATSFSSLRRWWQPGNSFATSDPINNVLALLTTHWDGELDRAAWSRQISFLLSGFMLLASFNAVLQTVRLFSRFLPKLVQHARTSLPLIVSQVAGTYVISSALLLRSNLPEEVSSVITGALGAPLEGRFVEGWFESWFLVAVGLTATGVLIGRKVGGDDGMWDDDEDMEMGSKRS